MSNFKDGRCIKKYLCIDCDKKISFASGIYGKGRCRSCSKKGKYSYNYGKKLSRKTRDKISKNHANHSGKNNPNFKHGKNCFPHYCLECNNKIDKYGRSKRCRSCYLKTMKGKNHPRFGKITHGKWGIYKGIYMRSSYEIKFAQFLDLSGYKWKYESKTFDLGNTTYTPDFYLPEWDLYIEIKGWWRDDAKEKFKEFKKIYPKTKIKLLMKLELQEIGVL